MNRIRSLFAKVTLSRSYSTLERECFVTNQGPVTIINLNRPSRKNAFGELMIAQLGESLKKIANDPSTFVIVVRSLVEGCFSAGADLKERAIMPQEKVAEFVDKLRNTFTMLEELPIPTIAALDGIALGGGLELALCCDLRYAGPETKLGLPETRLAILPAAGGSQRLSRLVGASKAKELVFTAAVLSPQEAYQYGIINGATSTNAFEHAMQVANKISQNGPLAIRYAKEAIDKGLSTDLKTGLTIEKLCYAQLIPTEDRREGLLAFKEGRSPIYKNR